MITCIKYVNAGLILGFRPANERQRYFVMTSLIGGHKPKINPVNIFIISLPKCIDNVVFNFYLKGTVTWIIQV